MKRISIIFAALALATAAPAMTACGTLSSVSGAMPSRVNQAKALIAAEDSLDVVVLAVEQGLDSGLIKGDNAAKAANLLKAAAAADTLAHDAYLAGNPAGGDAQVASLVTLVSDLNALVGQARHAQ